MAINTKSRYFHPLLITLFTFSNVYPVFSDAPFMLDGTSTVSATELKDLLSTFQNAILVDTRLPDKRDDGTIKGSVSLPHTFNHPQSLLTIAPDKTAPVIFYCEDSNSGRSMKAAKKAASMGYVNVIWFRGGITEWKQSGYPVESIIQ